MAPTMLDYALKYRRMGFSIIPCKKDKRPLLKWEPYQLQKPTEAEIKEWWGKWPDANIAVVCGQVSGVDVLDCDSQEAYDNVNDFYLSDSFQTPTVKTPKGRHLYFKHRSGLTNQVQAIKGTDIRTYGGYVVAPPSKNGNGNAYYWFDGLKPNEVEFSEWPDELFATLQAVSGIRNHNCNQSSLIITSNSNDHANHAKVSTTVYKYFEQGRRDQDIFHVANCLVKGHCEKDLVLSVLNILAKNCNPPFDEKEIEVKFNSASMRQNVRNRNLTAEVKDWILSTNGNFLSTDVYKDLQLSTRDEKKNVSIILKRMQDDGIIEKAGNINGKWRLIDQSCKPMDWVNASCEYKDLWMPLGLGEICGVQPGNILVFAGAKDSGKTAFLMNIAKENRHRYAVHYFNSEMGASEFKLRASKFDDVSVAQWKSVQVYERSENFADVIKPGEGNLNIIDFLEVVDEFWKVAATIQKIHQKLNGALCIAAIQKNPKADLGRGGAFSLEKARLYVSLDYQSAKIISCKNFKENDIISGNPKGYTCQYKLVQGCRIIKQSPGWTSPIEKEGAK